MTKSLSDNLYKGVTPIANGGTGSNSASAALTSLGAQAKLVSNTNIKTINNLSLLSPNNLQFINLNPTAIKVATYNANVNDLVRCDTTSSAMFVTVPATPADGATIGFLDVNGTFGTNAVTVASLGSATIENDTSIILNIPNIRISFIYNLSTNNWELLHNRQTGFGRIPDAPTIGTATVNQLTATVPFTAPTFNGNATINTYTATSSPGNLTGTITQAGSGSITVTGLSYSTNYTFTVVATNEIGNSTASSASNSISTPTVPNQPTVGVVVLYTNSSVTIPFTAPYDGGTTITSFTATSSPGGKTATVYQSGNGSIIITNLTAGLNYTFTVTASNAAGTSVASIASNSILIPNVPNQPTIGTVTYSNTTATIPVTAPYDGGSAITSYTATSSPDGLTGTLSGAAGGNITVSGLSYSVPYTFTVIATNAIGNSVASSVSNSITALPPATSIEYVVVGSGGAGGIAWGGGGGAGGLRSGSYAVSVGTSYTATVGAGSLSGVTSSFGVAGNLISALGGGLGAYYASGDNPAPTGYGSGGGASSAGTLANRTGAAGTAGQGYAGGTGSAVGSAAGGGGGAGGDGGSGTGSGSPGWGGAGVTTFIGTVAGGGGGDRFNNGTVSSGGSGGGGSGGCYYNATQATGGQANTGGGGGGNYSGSNTWAYGGSGVIGIRHPNTYRTATTTGSPTITDDGTYKIYKFIGSGTISF